MRNWKRNTGLALCLGIMVRCLNPFWLEAAESVETPAEETQIVAETENVESESESETWEEPESESETEIEEKPESESETESEEESESESETEIEDESNMESETDNNTQSDIHGYVFWAESEEEARIICEELRAQFVSWQNGIGVLEYGHILQDANAGKKRSGVVRLYPNYKYEVEGITYDTEINDQWHLELFDIGEVWKISTGKDIKVAVIDSGVDPEHEALVDNLAAAESVIPESAYGSNGFFLLYKGVQDNLGHGTHVAGIIGANAEDGSIMGIAPECDLYSIKALEKNGNTAVGYTSWIANAILKAVELDVDIINLSVGGSRNVDAFIAEAISIAAESGCIVVCAAGNYTGSGVQGMIDFPALGENTIAVTAGKQQENTVVFDSSYSKYGEGVDFIAPGTSILSTVLNGSGIKKGTSMACPMVAGTYALLMMADPDAEEAELTQLLRDTALDLGDTGQDVYYGSGLIQPLKALEAMENAEEEPDKKPDKETEKEETGGDDFDHTDEEPQDTEPVTPEIVITVPKQTEKNAEDDKAVELIIPETELPPETVETEIGFQPETEIVQETESEIFSETQEEQTERIEDLREKLDEIRPEDEVQYEIQERESTEEQIEDVTVKIKKKMPVRTGVVGGAAFAMLLILLILIRKKKETEEEN